MALGSQETTQNGSGSGSGDLYDVEGFLAHLGRTLIKRIQISFRLPKKSISNPLKTAQMAKTAQ